MFTVDEATAEAIRQAYYKSGELAGVVEFRRHFPLVNSASAWNCMRQIVSWRRPLEPAAGGE